MISNDFIIANMLEGHLHGISDRARLDPIDIRS